MTAKVRELERRCALLEALVRDLEADLRQDLIWTREYFNERMAEAKGEPRCDEEEG